MRRIYKICLFFTFLIVICVGVSFVWVKANKEGILSLPARAIFVSCPQARKIFKYYYAGDLAPNYLKVESYSKLIIEIDYLIGYKPEQKDLQWLVEFMKNYLDKPKGIEIIFSDEIQGSEASFNLEQIKNLEKKYRSFQTQKDTAILYFLFLNSFKDKIFGENFTGLAFDGSSIAVFVDRLRKERQSDYPFVNSVFAQNVLRHEFGHILGLVNSGFWKSLYPEREFGKRYFGIHESYFKFLTLKVAPGEHAHHNKNIESVMSREIVFYTDSQLDYFLNDESQKKLERNNLDETAKQEILEILKNMGYSIEFDKYDIEDLNMIRGYKLK